jgi:hypothetical protein
MLERYLARSVEVHVEDGSLRRRQQHLLDERLAFVPAAVAADELRPCAADGEVEDPRVRGVDQVEPDDVSPSHLGRERGLPVDQHDVAESAHGGERRPGPEERRDLPVFNQQVVE